MNALLMAMVLSAMPSAKTLEPGQPWSVVGARTSGAGASSLEAWAGWPAVSFGFLRGVAPRLDVGVRGAFLLGREGLTRWGVLPGLKVQGVLKVMFFESGMLSLAATFEPGPFFNVEFNQTVWGFALPIGLRLGIAASSALTLGVSLDVPMWAQFNGIAPGFNVPIEPGVGVEYFVMSNLLVFARVRMGPTIRPRPLPAELALDAHLGIGVRL